jgi:hypothetical protein
LATLSFQPEAHNESDPILPEVLCGARLKAGAVQIGYGTFHET